MNNMKKVLCALLAALMLAAPVAVLAEDAPTETVAEAKTTKAPAEEPKAEAPKAEEPKAEAPKTEEAQPQTEAPKTEEAKAQTEAPKTEEAQPQTEAPKAEEQPAGEKFKGSVHVKLSGSSTIHYGDAVTLKAVVSHANVKYSIRWEAKKNGAWVKVDSGKTYSFTVTKENDGLAYRAVVIGAECDDEHESNPFRLPDVTKKEETPAAQPAEEQPTEETPAEETPAEEQPTEETPAEETPAEEQPAEEQPAEEQPAEEQPAEEQPAEEQPTEETPAEETPAEEQPTEEQPAEEQPTEEQPTEEQPTEEEPAEETPAEEQPAEETPAEEQPTEEQPAEEEPTEEQPAEEEPAEEGVVTSDDEPAEEELPAEEEVPAEEAPAEDELADVEDEPVSYIITTTDSNVRIAADGLSEIYATIPQSTVLTLIGMDGDWAIVEYEGQIGYIYKEDIYGIDLPEEEVSEGEHKVTIFSSRRSVMRAGEIVRLTSRLEGFEDCTEIHFQWECDKGNGFEDVPGANADGYAFKASAETLSWDWRLKVSYR